jgi:lipopolysaccharide export LptBFGC system permease protein LptF
MRYPSIKYCILVSGFCLIAVSQTFAQKDGMSSLGGGRTRNRPEATGSADWKNQPRSYRRVIRELDLDFPDLEDGYWAGRQHNRSLKFETVIKAQIAVDMQVPSPDGSELSQVIKALAQCHNKLSKALQAALSLTEKQSRELESQASQRFKAAAKSSRLSRS